MPEKREKRNIARTEIINYMLNHSVTSKAELAKELGLSMPTVLTNVNELIAKGLIVENGEYASTGGRKAKSIGINKEYCRAMGLVITANHLEMVLVNLGYEIEHLKRVRLKFSPDIDYSVKIAGQVQQFLKECKTEKDILGIGIAIPGIIDQNEKTVLKSHALQVENYSLRFLEQALGFPVYFENDANSAMLAEDTQKYNNAIYLSLNHTLGGAFCIDGKLFRGQNQKAGEFGHMILIPGGDRCYCGKQGCADAYCAASVLTGDGKNSLEVFMEQLKQGNKEAEQKWERYLDHLAILISNLRMAYDMDIILGGDVGGVLAEYMIPLGQRVLSYNGFDRDISYLKNCSYEKEANILALNRIYNDHLESYCNACQRKNRDVCQSEICKLQQAEYRKGSLEKNEFIKFCYNLNPECDKQIFDRECLGYLLIKDGMMESVFPIIKEVAQKNLIEREDKIHIKVKNKNKVAYVTAISSIDEFQTVENIAKAMEKNQGLVETIFEADQLITTRLKENSDVWDSSCIKVRPDDIDEVEINHNENSIFVPKRPEFIKATEVIENMEREV